MSAFTLIVDGGTTNTRVTLLDSRNQALATEKRAVGVGQTAVDGHNGQLKAALKEAIETLLDRHSLSPMDIGRCVAYGMITSSLGLAEVPHLIAPAGAAELRAGMQRRAFPEIAPFPMHFIPGVRNSSEPVTLDTFSRMDMMRGEETEAVGLWHALTLRGPCVLVLPGSHNKFIRMDGEGRIMQCLTSLSGELLAALTNHTILAEAVDRAFLKAEDYDDSLVLAGFHEAEKSGLGRAAFAGRILRTLGKMAPEQVAGYLMGVVLQTDAAALRSFCPKEQAVYVAGQEPLTRALSDVLRCDGFQSVHPVPREASAKMGVAGALEIAG